MDYQATLYGPVYAQLGVSATLTLEGGGTPFPFVVLDKTSGVDISFGGGEGGVQTIAPAAVVRVPELRESGIKPNDLVEAVLAMNGYTWRVKSFKLRPSPNGEDDGEAYLLLVQKRAAGKAIDPPPIEFNFVMAATLAHGV